MPPTEQTEIALHAEAVRLPFAALVGELRQVLGARLVAYLGSVKETRAVSQWADGSREPDTVTQRRLREAFVVARLLATVDSAAVVRTWFEGLNPVLDDRSPARVLREADLDAMGPEILRAARGFIAG